MKELSILKLGGTINLLKILAQINNLLLVCENLSSLRNFGQKCKICDNLILGLNIVDSNNQYDQKYNCKGSHYKSSCFPFKKLRVFLLVRDEKSLFMKKLCLEICISGKNSFHNVCLLECKDIDSFYFIDFIKF